MCIRLSSYESFGKLCLSRNLFISSKFKYNVVYKILFLVPAILMPSFIHFCTFFFSWSFSLQICQFLKRNQLLCLLIISWHMLVFYFIAFCSYPLFFLTMSFGLICCSLKKNFEVNTLLVFSLLYYHIHY